MSAEREREKRDRDRDRETHPHTEQCRSFKSVLKFSVFFLFSFYGNDSPTENDVNDLNVFHLSLRAAGLHLISQIYI